MSIPRKSHNQEAQFSRCAKVVSRYDLFSKVQDAQDAIFDWQRCSRCIKGRQIILLNSLPKGSTITRKYYTNLLDQRRIAIREKISEDGLLQQVNVSITIASFQWMLYNAMGMKYSRLSLSRSPRDFLKYFEISVPRHIRFAELRKK